MTRETEQLLNYTRNFNKVMRKKALIDSDIYVDIKTAPAFGRASLLEIPIHKQDVRQLAISNNFLVD